MLYRNSAHNLETCIKMPPKAIIYGITVISLVIIIGGAASWTLANFGSSSGEPVISPNPIASDNSENSDTVMPTNSPQDNEAPVLSPTEQIRDSLMAYLQTNHPEITSMLPNSPWQGGLQSIGADNSQLYIYNSSGWVVTIQFNDSPNAQYFVTANYKTGTIYWEGTYENDVFAEITYSANGSPSLISTQEQVRDSAMTFIKTKHVQTAQLMTSLEWVGQRDDAGLVGQEKYVYTSGDWTVTVSYPVTSNPTYNITADYSADSYVSWQGTYQQGAIKETIYKTNLSTSH